MKYESRIILVQIIFGILAGLEGGLFFSGLTGQSLPLVAPLTILFAWGMGVEIVVVYQKNLAGGQG